MIEASKQNTHEVDDSFAMDTLVFRKRFTSVRVVQKRNWWRHAFCRVSAAAVSRESVVVILASGPGRKRIYTFHTRICFSFEITSGGLVCRHLGPILWRPAVGGE